jgi:hypothetical protein
MSTSHLPQEIIDDIIGRVDGLVESNGSLALVSKAFRPRVQRLLFHHIILDDKRPGRTERLSRVLARNPTLGEYVHKVSLVHSRAGIYTEMAQAPDMLEHILRACRIQTLSITHGIIPQQMIQLLSFQNLPSLRSLKLGSVSRIRMDALHDILSLHPPLDQLVLCTSHLYSPWSSRRERIPVKRLQINASCLLPENDWTFENLYSVEEEFTIRVMIASAPEIVAVNKALQVWGTALRRLRFDLLYFALPQRESSCHHCSKAR